MYDKKFYTLLDYVFADEGGFSNHKNDRGGRTGCKRCHVWEYGVMGYMLQEAYISAVVVQGDS